MGVIIDQMYCSRNDKYFHLCAPGQRTLLVHAAFSQQSSRAKHVAWYEGTIATLNVDSYLHWARITRSQYPCVAIARRTDRGESGERQRHAETETQDGAGLCRRVAFARESPTLNSSWKMRYQLQI